MSQTVDVLEEPSVIASLHLGPKGTVRLSYEYSHFDMTKRFLGGFAFPAATQQTYLSPVIEIDRTKLKDLKFSQQELAEIGFSLVLRLSALARHAATESDA
jgi:hypothetical protein